MPGEVDRILRDRDERLAAEAARERDARVLGRATSAWMPARLLTEGDVHPRGAGAFLGRLVRAGLLVSSEGPSGRLRYRRPI